MSNELVQKIEKNVPVVRDEFFEQLLADFEPPKVTIGQGSPKVGKVGHFNFSTGESLEKLSGVVFLGKVQGYVLYGGKGKAPARCASDDGITPAIRIAQPLSAKCEGCFANKWGQDAQKDKVMLGLGLDPKEDKPICNNTRSITLANEDGFPIILVVKTHNVKIVDQFLVPNIFLKAKRFGVHPLGCAFDILLESVPGEGNRYKLKFDNWRALEADKVSERQFLYERFGGLQSAKYISEIHARQDAENALESSEDDGDVPF